MYRPVYINGEPHKVGYIDDLKVHPAFRGSRVALKLVKTLLNYAMTEEVDLYFCLIVHGNEKILPFL